MTVPTILVATWDAGLFAVTGDQAVHEIVGQPVRGLTADGRGGALAIVGGHSLQRRTSSGAWSTLATSEVELSCCLAVGSRIYVGTEDARMLLLSPQSGMLHPLEGFDKVEGRETWFAGSAIVNGQRLGPPLGIRSVAANSNGTVLFANVHVGGIPRSTDGGRTWQPTIDIHADIHEVRAHPTDPDVIAAASGAGLCISHDAGATWTIEREGLHAHHCSAVAFSGDDILVSAAESQFAAEGRIYRRPAGAKGKIAPVEDGLPTWMDGIVDTGCIDTTGPIAIAMDRGGALYFSVEFSRSWSRRTCGPLPAPSSILICWHTLSSSLHQAQRK
jgi:hypothetical protein